jgi:DNA-binding response OmpR family regulator
MRPKKIVVADDDPDIVLALKVRLEAAGYEILTAADGCEAVERIRTSRPDLAILDINMPRGNAFSVLDAMTNEGLPRMPVIFLTADTQEKSQVKAFHRGIRHYLTKPYDPKTLLVLIEHALASGAQSAA